MIKDILTEDLIETDIECKSWRECVKYLGSLLEKKGKVDSGFINYMIKAVEEFGPYMILIPEVGFFHAQPNESVKEPCISLITLKDEVVFDDFNNEKIKSAFAFGATDHESHIKLLADISELLNDEGFVKLLRSNGSKEEILNYISKY